MPMSVTVPTTLCFPLCMYVYMYYVWLDVCVSVCTYVGEVKHKIDYSTHNTKFSKGWFSI